MKLSPATTAPAADDARLREAARNMEAILLRQMLRSSGVYSGGEGPGASVRQDMFVNALADVEGVEVEADHRARVVVSERTGVLVAGEGVRLRPVAVAHGGLSVHVQQDPVVSQPGAFAQKGDTVSTSTTHVDAREATGSAVALKGTATVEDLARALNLLGASPRDLVAVLEAIKAAGALDGELEVLE